MTWLQLNGYDNDLDHVPVYGLLPAPHTLPLVVAIEELAPTNIQHFILTRDDDYEEDFETTESSMQW